MNRRFSGSIPGCLNLYHIVTSGIFCNFVFLFGEKRNHTDDKEVAKSHLSLKG